MAIGDTKLDMKAIMHDEAIFGPADLEIPPGWTGLREFQSPDGDLMVHELVTGPAHFALPELSVAMVVDWQACMIRFVLQSDRILKRELQP